MAGPNASYEGVQRIVTGQHVQPAAPVPMPLGTNTPCRRVVLYDDEGDTVYLCTQREAGQAAAAVANVGFPIPTAGTIALWVGSLDVIWICGAAGGETVYWVAEEV